MRTKFDEATVRERRWATCLPTILLAPRIIGVAPTVAYVIFWFAFVIFSGMLIGAWL